MRIFGLVGYPLAHSFSEIYFAEKFSTEGITDAVYRNFPLEDISGLRELVKENMLDGFNVTIPHKETIIPLLDEISPVAHRIGAVNCVVRDGSRLTGYNTDHYGFRVSLLRLIGEDRPAALILGTGGASKAVRYVLDELGMEYLMVSTHPEAAPGRLSYGQLDETLMRSHRLIINATPVGTYPDVAGSPAIPYDLLTDRHYLFDMVYNPPLTRFLSNRQARGARVRNGYQMLTLQADKAWEIFNGAVD